MLKAIKAKVYPADHCIYVEFRPLPKGTFVKETLNVSVDLQGPTYATRMSNGQPVERVNWLPQKQYDVYVDYDVNDEVHGIELLRDDEETIAFAKSWCESQGLEWPTEFAKPFKHTDDTCDVANVYLCPGPKFCDGAEREDYGA